MPSATIKAATNIPLVGTVKYMDYYPAKQKDGKEFAAQISLKGLWDGHGEGTVYLPAPVGRDILTAGLARQDGKKSFQGAEVPQFRWDYQGKVRVLKSEEGLKRHTTVTPVDAASAVPAAAKPTGGAVVLGPTAFSNGPTANWWRDQEGLMRHCIQLATKVHGSPGTDGQYQGMTSTAHSFYIQANREKMGAPATVEQIRDTLDSFAEVPAGMNEPDDGLPF